MIIEVNPNKKNKNCSPVIGFEAENKVTGFEFDYSDWAADIGDGYLTLSVKRPTDTIPYPVSLTQTGTHKATWTVSSTDVAFAGRGEVQLTYIVDDKVKKSAIYGILIDRSLEPDGDIPDPYISWFEELLQVSVQVTADADRAEAAADSIKNLEAVAVTLPSGASASAEYDPDTGVMTFGIPKGDKGDTGETGAAGNGISSTVLNADYTLTINFTDGTSYTTPSIRGPEGAQGQTGPTGNGIDNVTMDASGYLTITFTDGTVWTSPTSLFGPVQDVKVNGESVVDENGVANITVPIITKTVSGNPIVLDDADGAVQALHVDLLPVQDLHGYDKPWSAGAGKNKLPPTTANTPQTIAGITWTVNADGSITASGTSTARSVFIYLIVSAADATVLSGSYKGVLGNGSNLNSMSSGIKIGDNWGGFNAQTMTVNGALTQVWFSIEGTGTTVNKTIYPMIVAATETSTIYTPYENNCPITGRTQTDIGVTDGDTQSHTTTVTLPHTVYGADVDVTGGEGTENLKLIDASTLGWNYDAGGKRWQVIVSDIYNYPSRNATLWSDRYSADITATTGDEGKMFTVGKVVYIYSTDGVNAPTGQLCYPLATPTDLSTTPTDVELYKGDNVVTGDGNMTMEYVRNLQMVIDKIEAAL